MTHIMEGERPSKEEGRLAEVDPHSCDVAGVVDKGGRGALSTLACGNAKILHT